MKHYKPGMKALISGIYEAIHGASHRLQHEVTLSENTIFPVCRRCRLEVRFRLVRPIKSLEQGWAPFGIVFEPYSTGIARNSNPR
jgi:hypothetical protein